MWVVDQQNALRNRKVSTLRTQGKHIYVTDGLQDGDRVCLTLVGAVVAGTPVTIGSTISSDSLLDDPSAPVEVAAMPEGSISKEAISQQASMGDELMSGAAL